MMNDLTPSTIYLTLASRAASFHVCAKKLNTHQRLATQTLKLVRLGFECDPQLKYELRASITHTQPKGVEVALPQDFRVVFCADRLTHAVQALRHMAKAPTVVDAAHFESIAQALQ